MVQKIQLTDTEARKRIAKTLNVSKSYISLALNFQRDSDTARKIRRAALNSGGVLLKEAN
jgi:hypothetical protein